MLKRRDSPYVAGRRTGLWYKWKRDPLVADCVLMYAQRGSGKRSSYYSDYTFGCWTDGDELLLDDGEDAEFLGQDVCFLGQAIVSQIATQQQHVRLAVDRLKQRLQRTARGLLDVKIADGS